MLKPDALFGQMAEMVNEVCGPYAAMRETPLTVEELQTLRYRFAALIDREIEALRIMQSKGENDGIQKNNLHSL